MDIFKLLSLKDDLRGVNRHWGDKMPMMTMEEAGELIQAISKLERSEDLDPELVDGVVTEMADVLIAVGALGYRYGISLNDVLNKVNEKLNKRY